MTKNMGVALISCALLLGACDDEGSSAGGFKTSIQTSKQVDKLTDTESAQLCKDLDAWGATEQKKLAPTLCRADGFESKSKAECEMAVADCIKVSPKSDCDALSNCSSTVAEVQKCLADSLDAITPYFSKFPTCAQLADRSAIFPARPPASPASCVAIKSKCPRVAAFGEFEEVEVDSQDVQGIDEL